MKIMEEALEKLKEFGKEQKSQIIKYQKKYLPWELIFLSEIHHIKKNPDKDKDK